MLTESQFQANVITLARLQSWAAYHTFDSRRSTAGFPDLVLLRGHEQIVAELKSDKGKPSTAQTEWLRAFADVRTVDAYLWRPGDLDEINQRLSPRVTRRAA